MSDLLQTVQDYVEVNIGAFHEKRLDTVRNKNLDDILRRKNPYLFKAKSQTVIQMMTGIMDAFLSSQEEGLFGTFLEGVAVLVASEVYGGNKPEAGTLTGIDLVFERDDNIYIVEIKSGPNWGNSSQVARMLRNFRDAMSSLQPLYPGQSVIPVNGCMYGKGRKPQKEGKIKEAGRVVDIVPYWKLCGQDFWNLISDDPELYTLIIEPLGYRARKRNTAFQEEYNNFLNRLVRDFLNRYCNENGSIAWDELTRFVSKSENDAIIAQLAASSSK